MTIDMRRGIACAGNWSVDQVHTASHWPAKCVGGGAATGRKPPKATLLERAQATAVSS
jgi:hypothetical protein